MFPGRYRPSPSSGSTPVPKTSLCSENGLRQHLKNYTSVDPKYFFYVLAGGENRWQRTNEPTRQRDNEDSAIQSDSVRFCPIRSDSVRFCAILSDSIRLCPILSDSGGDNDNDSDDDDDDDDEDDDDDGDDDSRREIEMQIEIEIGVEIARYRYR